MAVAISVRDYLKSCSAQYELVPHALTKSTLASARTAHINPHQVAKAVVLRDTDTNYLMAVIPADCRLSIGALSFMLDKDLSLVNEWELSELFQDCADGAVPCLGQAYGIDIIWDDALMNNKDIYFEAGDHRQLVHIGLGQFQNIMGPFLHDEISINMADLNYSPTTIC